MFDFLLYKEDAPLIFTQPAFWYFFGFVIICYLYLYKTVTARNMFLMVMSMYFYYLCGGYFFTLLILSTVMDYYLGKTIHNLKTERSKKLLITFSLVVNLGLLAYFKYSYFFADSVNYLFGTSMGVTNYLAVWTNAVASTNFDVDKILLPVGISFYTFQSISYIIDIYRKEIEPVRNILDYAFFVSFFPQLVAGPIVRASDFIPQIYEKYRLSNDEFGRAVFLIINGLVKKIFISDYVSTNFVDRVFEDPSRFTGFENLMATYGYTIQIYCDFSGYTDIAIGVALLLGFRLNLNFNSPYKAINITDFWRRWHISLSSWLRDYLYISMGGNRKGKLYQYLFLFITMFLGGLWHGASVRFIIWGALHGIALALHKMWMQYFPLKNSTFIGNALAWLLTFHFVAFCWIFFRADNMDIVNSMLTQIAFHFQPELIGEMLVSYRAVFAVMLIGYLIHWLPADFKLNVSNTITQVPDFAKAIIIVGVMLLLFQVKTSAVQPFIYFQF